MMRRSNPFARYICIILMIVNCSVNAEHAKFTKTTVKRSSDDGGDGGVPTDSSLFVISENKTTATSNDDDDDDTKSTTLFFNNQNETIKMSDRINESSQQRAAVDFVLLPEFLAANYGENRHENSKPNQSIQADPRQQHKRMADTQDMCDTNECKCKLETKFLTVDCNFRQHYTLDASKMIRTQAETLLITLASDAEFQLDGNVLTNNRLNRILIQGSGMESGREHVEIHSNAFNGNAGPFPEIEIVNIHSVDIHSNAFYFEFKLNITNCAKVRIFSEAFANTTFHGHFENIRDLSLLERAFSKSSAKVTIHKCHLDEVQRLDASLKEIKFSNTHIGTVRTNAFDVIKIDAIIFEHCNIDTIQTNAFTEKLFSNQLSLTDCNVGIIETAAISGSGITDFILHNNSISLIKEKAIRLTSVTSLIQGNNISLTERFWFRIEGWSTVLVDNNHFGFYQQMGVEITKDPIRCIFENNYITKTVSDSLNFKSPHCRVKQVSFDRACSCNSTYFRHLSYIDISADSFCRIDTTLAHCFNASLYNVKAYKDDICDDSAQIDCVRDRINAKPNGYFIDLDRLFNRTDKLLYIYVGAGIALIIVIILLLCMIVRRCVRRKKDFDEGPTRDIVLMERLHPTTATLTTQVYFAEPFSHNDLIIMNQTLKEMKQKYPPEIYDQVDNNTRKLIGGQLTETDRVKTIAEIVQCLDDCEDIGIDFIAFTDILYNHLGCETTQVHQINGPIYAEPGLAHLDIVNSTTTGRNNNNFIGDAGGGGVGGGGNDGGSGIGIGGAGEHIYAEPMNLQQPLLRNEYNVPVDNRVSTSHMYSEPITGAIDYISSNPIKTNFDPSHLYAQPSKSIVRINQPLPSSSQLPSSSSPSQPLSLSPSKKYVRSPAAAAAEPSTSSASTKFANANPQLPKTSYLGETFKNSAHSSSQESNNSHSDHSGASGVTLPLDEPIEYADA